MFQHIYKLLIEPRATDPDQQNRELVLNWLLTGINCLLAIFSASSILGFLLNGKSYTLWGFIFINIALGISLAYSILWRSKKYSQKIASNILIAFIFFTAVLLVFEWGIINTYGILLFCLVIIMAGILVNARYSLYAAVAIGLTLAAFEYARSQSMITVDISWAVVPTSTAEVINFSTIFFIIAFVSWLFNKQMEQSLERARRSEKALQKERDMLEVKVAERTVALEKAQLEKVQQFYRFAELGHLSTALFHDLASNLTSLSVDIESLRKRGQTDFTKRIDTNIRYIDSVVQRVKSQIQGKDSVETFDVIAEIKDLVGILSFNARKARTNIAFQVPQSKQPVYFTGNLTRFRQLVINLLSNAIEAYPPAPASSSKSRPVIIKVLNTEASITLHVTDYGKGIAKNTQEKIFDPFYTTKDTGSGIGLFIVRQVAETDFNGKIILTSSKKTGTTFVVTLPKESNATAS